MRIARRSLGIAGALMLAVVLAGCGGDEHDNDPPTASGTVGPAGGSVASADGSVALTVPPGALAASTQIRITALAGNAVPAHIRAENPALVYRLEPAGTSFAMPARLSVRLPAGNDLAVLVLESAGSFEIPANLAFRTDQASRIVEADVPHFSHAFVHGVSVNSVHATFVVDRDQQAVGGPVQATFTLHKDATLDTFDFYPSPGFFVSDHFRQIDPTDVLSISQGTALTPTTFRPNEALTLTDTRTVTCTAEGSGYVGFKGSMDDLVARFVSGNLAVGNVEVDALAFVQCVPAPPPPPALVSVGLFNVPGLTALDSINYFAGPVANLTGTGPYAAIAGAEGVKVVDMVTRAVVLDRTATGPDGATLGTSLLGATPVAQAASAGAPAAMFGFNNTGATVQNWNATNNWGASITDAEPTFDAVTAGGGVVSNTVALVRPVRGIDFVSFDGTANAYRIDQARFAPYSAFPGTGNLTSAQMVDAASGDLLVLGRAAGPSISTSTKVFYKAPGDAQATTLLSMGNIDARRLRCIPVGALQSCVATMFSIGQGRAFLHNPASPRATPAVIVLTAAAGTLGVAQALLPNGNIAVAMANFTANSLTVAELSPNLATIHSLGDIPAPTGCTGTAHVALLTDSEGLKAVTTCNGTNNYWVVKLP